MLSRLPVAKFHTLFQPATPGDLSPVEVCTIVKRWDHMRQLAAAYQLPSLHFKFIGGTLPYLPPTLDGSDPNLRNEQDFHLDQHPLRLSQFKAQDEFQRRVYQAVSALWLVWQAIKLTNIIQYPNDAEHEVRRLLGTLLNCSLRMRQGGLNSATNACCREP